MPHFIEVDAQPANLDLVVVASNELEVVVRQPPCDVASPIHSMARPERIRPEQIRNEALRQKRGLSQVSIGESCAANVDFTTTVDVHVPGARLLLAVPA